MPVRNVCRIGVHPPIYARGISLVVDLLSRLRIPPK